MTDYNKVTNTNQYRGNANLIKKLGKLTKKQVENL